MKLKIKLLAICVLIFAVFSCTDFSMSTPKNGADDIYGTGKVRLCGTITMPDFTGAVPSVAAQVNENSFSNSEEKSAAFTPINYNDTEYQYFAEAKKRGTNETNSNASFEGTYPNKTFTLVLDYGYWDITAGIKKGEQIIFSDTQPVELKSGEPTQYSASFTIKPQMTESGTGKIALEMNTGTDLGIDCATVSLLYGDNDAMREAWNTAGMPVVETYLTNSNNKFTLTAYSIKSGSYTVQIRFYDFTGGGSGPNNINTDYFNGYLIPVYSTIQTINVYDNLTTNYWVKSVGQSIAEIEPINADGTFTLNQNIINNYSLTDIYVAQNGQDSNSGSVYKPFGTLAKAVTYINERGDGNKDYSITVDGEIECYTTIDLNSERARSLKIKGKTSNQQDKLNGNQKGSVVTIDTSVPVTFENISITGGSATNGGGINITSGTVKLASGAVVTGNVASSSGGGVYVDTNGTLCMYGTSLIGDPTTSLPDVTNNKYGNKAGFGAGIYNKGIVALGYDAYESETSNHETELTGGVCRNYGDKTEQNFVNSGGAGIYTYSNTSEKGIVSIKTGKVSYNMTKSHGGGIKAYKGGKETVYIKGGSISNNNAAKGGGIYIDGNGSTVATVNISGGTIEGNEATTAGGAIYQSGKLNFSSNAKLNSGSEKTNDVYLVSTNTITVNSLSSTGTVATITPSEWKRGKKVLDGSYASSNISKFALSGGVWSVISHDNFGKIEYKDIYVGDGGIDNLTSARGTYTSPYLSIKYAAEQCWNSDTSYNIIIKDVLTNTDTTKTQQIPASGVSASAITLKGNSANANIDGSEKGSVLDILNTTIPITIQSLIIQNGKNTSQGGGGIRNAGNLTLGDGAKVSGNEVLSEGGGIYNSGTLALTSGSTVTGNKATAGGGIGGGICNEGKLFIYGTARIGGTGTGPATVDSGNSSGQHGGGIYNKSGYLYIGYRDCKSDNTPNNEQEFTGGITQNYAGVSGTSSGGGVYITGGKVYFKSGNILYNRAAYGGGVKVMYNSEFVMSGGTVSSNTATSAGGGIHIEDQPMGTGKAYFTMSGGTISDNTLGSGSNGTGVYNGGTMTMSGDAQIASGQNVYLYSGKNINLSTTTLSNHSTSNQIVIKTSMTAGNTVLSGATNNVKAHYRKFKTTTDGLSIDSQGNLFNGYYATTSTVLQVIQDAPSSSSSPGYRIVVTGSTNNSIYANIGTKLKTLAKYISLDLSGIEGTTIVPDEAFKDCNKLTSIMLPTTITKIQRSSFSGCSELTSVTGLDNVTELFGNAFAGCSSISDMSVPKVQTFFSNCFYGWGENSTLTIGTAGQSFTIKGGSQYNVIQNASYANVYIGPKLVMEQYYPDCYWVKN